MELLDTYGRIARDLRLSVTDRCSLRCHYCMPAEGVPLIPRPELLTADEMVRLAGIAVGDLGVSRIRVTGGEPLVRRDLAAIVERLADLTPRPELALTTNGVGLAGRAHELARAGLDRVTVSLDTLDPTTFATLARRDRLSDVLAAIRAAVALWPGRVKINAVALPETLAEGRAAVYFS
ncbi:MAG: radical SAM protein, partial [Mycobacteriales bacterium]